MVFDAGVMFSVGGLVAQTLIVVVALLDVPLVWPAADAVTVVLFVPVDFPVTARTCSCTVVFAPGPSITEFGVSTDGTTKSVVLESVAPRLKVVLLHAAVSVFVTVTV